MKFGFATLLCFLIQIQVLIAQGIPEFNMSNTTVSNCKGILFDNGGPSANYANNANFTFTICLNEQVPLTLTFEQFCVEQGFDSLMIFAGPNAQSPQIGTALSGISLPQPITVNSGCVTLVFVSDANVTCSGFRIRWTSLIIPPVPPTISMVLNPPYCNKNQFQLQLNKKIACDSVYATAVQVSGPSNPTVVSAISNPCTGDSTQTISVQLNPGFTVGGTYQISLRTRYKDACDSVWNFISMVPLQVFDCPIEVNIQSSSTTICSGTCVTLEAQVTGGNGNYTYQWSNGLPPTPGPHTVCLTTTSVISLTVDDTSPAAAASGSTTIQIFQNPVTPPDFSLCQSADSLLLIATPPNGIWSGNGLSAITPGLFYPDSTGGGVHILVYSIAYAGGLQCSDTTIATIAPIDAGLAEAACPGTASFFLTGGVPAGGTWSGPFTQANGLFDPQTQGTYQVTYTLGSCSDTKWVYVDNVSQIPTIIDTLCQSDASVRYELQPPGGRWVGPGIVDSLLGWFDPGEAGGGLHIINYVLNGCTEQIQIYVKPVFAGWNQSACPVQEAFILPDFNPVGGTWAGQGISNTATGLFNPQFNNQSDFVSDLIYFAPNGCTDTLRMFVVKTTINSDTLRFCLDSAPILLVNDVVGNAPWAGSWTGNGIIQHSNPDSVRFSPVIAGQGVHVLYYDINTCFDSLVVIVEGSTILPPDFLICENQNAVQLQTVFYVSQGAWSGTSVSNTGIFSPQQAGAGQHEVYFLSSTGCRDTAQLLVTDFPTVSISGLETEYCLRDTLIALSYQPTGAQVFGSGVVNSFFNPLVAGGGDQTIYISAGELGCQAIDSIKTYVKPPLSYTLIQSKDSICNGEFVSIQIQAFAGVGQSVAYTWSGGLPSVSQQVVAPIASVDYFVSITDGCALFLDTARVFVYPKIEYSLLLPDSQCFGLPADVQLQVSYPDNFQATWYGTPVQTGTTFSGNAGFTYLLKIVDNETTCSTDSVVSIPGFPLVFANFTITPNSTECLPADDNLISFIDLSTGGVQGQWNFGNGTIQEYSAGINPQQLYENSGNFTVELSIADTNGCESKANRSFCINNPKKVFIPSAFSPLNTDDLNPVFTVYGLGIKKVDLKIYNRWQQLIYSEKGESVSWDGTYMSQLVPLGVYAYLVEITWEDNTTFTKVGSVHMTK